MQTAYLKALVEIGFLARLSAVLREECTLAAADAQLSIGVSALGDELGGQLARRRGWVFIDPDFVARAYASGELPVDQTFAGIVEGQPKDKIRTGAFEPAPARVYRTQPKKPDAAA